MSSNEPYVRVRIRGVLRAIAELRVGSGDEWEQRPEPTLGEADAVARLISGLSQDVHGRPFIPGASLRGWLRHRLGCAAENHSPPSGGKTLCQRIFGEARRSDETASNGDFGDAGCLRVADALLTAPPGGPIPIRHGVGIDAVLGTATEGHLYAKQVAPRGSRFAVELELTDCAHEEVRALLAALAGFRTGSGAALGQGKGHGRGQLAWESTAQRVDVLDDDAFDRWLRDDTAPIADAWRPLDIQASPALSSAWVPFHLCLQPLAPLLIADPELKKAKREDDHQPDHYFLRDRDRAVVPGASLRGLIRARCRRILITLLAAKDQGDQLTLEKAGRLLTDLFGGTERMGLIRVDDARGRFSPENVHTQTFNAIDRFTGGTAPKLLYSVEAVRPRRLRGRVWLCEELFEKDHQWALGLLTLTLRDAMEGDLALGWGKGRGYGAFRSRIRPPGARSYLDWPGLLDAHRAAIEAAVTALEQKITEEPGA